MAVDLNSEPPRPSNNDLGIYTPLSEFDEIRLLVLEPAEDDAAVLVGRLKPTQLRNRPIFEALSWVWGDDKHVEEINLQGSFWNVSKQLTDALRSLRRPDRPRTIWVDALCINQGTAKDALDERSRQVRLMRYIYPAASHVIIWMGHRPDLADIFHGVIRGELEALARNDYKGTLNQLNNLLRNQWWWRLWVVQEVSLAVKASIYIGKANYAFKHFLHDLERFEEHLSCSPGDDRHGLKEDFLGNMHTQVARFKRLLVMAEKSQFRWNLPPLVKDRPGREELVEMDHFQVLSVECRHQLTSDPHDKIYGLLGLASDSVAQLIQPHYDEPVAETFTRTSGLLAEKTRRLRLLGQVSRNVNLNRIKDLPTWVPDWSIEFSEYERTQLEAQEKVFSMFGESARGKDGTVKYCGNGVLRVHGLLIDSVKAVGRDIPPGRSFDEWKRAIVTGWETTLRETLMQRSEEEKHEAIRNSKRLTPPNASSFVIAFAPQIGNDTDTSHGTEEFEEPEDGFPFWKVFGDDQANAFWLTVLHGTAPDPSSVFRKLGSRRLEGWRMLLGMERSEYDEKVFEHLRNVTENRRFFVTEDGFMGNTGEVAEGDQIFLLAGARLPVVLRQSVDEPNTYKFVGECYVPGISEVEDLDDRLYVSKRQRTAVSDKRVSGAVCLSLSPDLWETIFLI
ncbi:hypothetical protein RBB50_002804 [Rhinocladiella similis]